MLDATGLGDPIADDLTRAGVPVEPFKITEQSKKDIIEKLSVWIEQKQLHMLSLPETLLEFDNFSYEIGPTGRIRYTAPEGYNDDIVISHALAVWSLNPLYKATYEKPKTVLQESYEEQKISYEETDQNLAELDEWNES
jgi:hypothetical protein